MARHGERSEPLFDKGRNEKGMKTNTSKTASTGSGRMGAPSRRAGKALRRNERADRMRDFIERRMPFEMRERALRGWARGYKEQLALLLEAFGARRVNGRIASFRTRESRGEVLYPAFAVLRQLGYKIDNVMCLRTAHVQALMARWVAEGNAASTINQRLSVLRIFAGWIGKAGLVPPVAKLGALGFDPSVAGRKSTAQRDKSWDRPETDKEAILAAIEGYDLRYGLIFRLCDMFGLRKQEAVRWCPHEHDWEREIAVLVGAKNGKERRVPFSEPAARALIERCKAAVEPKDSMSGKALRNLKQAREHFAYVARRFGVTFSQLGITAHGLRHGFVQRRTEEDTGAHAPVKDPDAPWPQTPQAREARRRVMEAVGHSRPTVITGYTGAARRTNRAVLRRSRRDRDGD